MAESSDAQKATNVSKGTNQIEVTAAQFLRSPIVTVIVGKGRNAQSFPIYKDLLIAYSPYFKACLIDNWEEGKTNTVRLEDDDPKAFETVANWLFRDPSTMKRIDMNFVEAPALRYKLADKLLMTQLKNDIFDETPAFHLASNQWTSIGGLKLLCSKGLQTTALYDYCLKSYVWGFRHPREDIMKDLITQVFEFMHQSWGDPRIETGCVYHDHSDGSSCNVVRGVKRRHE